MVYIVRVWKSRKIAPQSMPIGNKALWCYNYDYRVSTNRTPDSVVIYTVAAGGGDGGMRPGRHCAGAAFPVPVL